VELNDNLKRLSSALTKVDILWERSATTEMLAELGRREREERAAAVHG
jgi:hypothetical protein